MTAFWRIPNTDPGFPPPDWVQPFLELDAEWNAGRAVGRTSGSTGTPKSVAFDPAAVRASAHATAIHFGLNTNSDTPIQAWSALPALGVGGRMMWWRTRILGWTLTQSRPSTSPMVPEPAAGERHDFAVATPQQAAAMAQTGQLRKIRILLLGGGAVSPSLETALQSAGLQAQCQVHLGFGMTETLTHVATRPLGEPVYTLLPGVTWSADADGGLLLDAPERGVHALHTRDAAEAATTASGSPGFRWLGRLDDVINTGGLKVHPTELEGALDPLVEPHLDGRRWYVAGRPHPTTGEQVTLVVEGEADAQQADRLLAAVAQGHPHSDRPRAVVWMARFEETGTGKVVRR